jgi:hypothetical protein
LEIIDIEPQQLNAKTVTMKDLTLDTLDRIKKSPKVKLLKAAV